MHAPKAFKCLNPFSNCCLHLYLKHVYAKLSPEKQTDPHGFTITNTTPTILRMMPKSLSENMTNFISSLEILVDR